MAYKPIQTRQVTKQKMLKINLKMWENQKILLDEIFEKAQFLKEMNKPVKSNKILKNLLDMENIQNKLSLEILNYRLKNK